MKLLTRIILRFIILYIILLVSVTVAGQQVIHGGDDTVRIKEIVIRPVSDLNGSLIYKKSGLDSAILNNSGLMTLGEILSWHSPVFIKNYGPEGTATPSFRGTGAGNTNVTWNGIKVDHPMVGQADLSLLPSGIIDELHILYGGAAMESGSGATGGVIAIENKPSWENRTSVTIYASAGSFARYSGNISIRTGSEKFQSVTRAYINSSVNNFTYINSVYSKEPFTTTRKHNNGNQEGFLQEFYYRKAENVLSLRLWYQTYARNIPASLLVYPENNGGQQSDENVRLMVNYDFGRGEDKFYIAGALMNAKLNYLNSVSAIDSRNLSNVLLVKSGARIKTGNYSELNLLINNEFCTVFSNNYDVIPDRNIADFSANMTSKNTGKIGGNILLRQLLYNNQLLIPDFSGGVFFKTGAKDYFIKANFSRSSRIPSMNDLFWYPGGNPRLKNEYSYISELSYEINESTGTSFRFKTDFTLYNNSINNMIRWKPGPSSQWTAENVGSARSYGMESSLKAEFSLNKFKASMFAGYNYTRSYDKQDKMKRQLIYIPVNQMNASMSVQYGKINASWRSVFSGRRFTDTDISHFLSPYFVSTMSAGMKHKPSWGLVELAFDVENAFNEEYQTMAYYPLPGRSYRIRITTQIINKRI